MENKQVIKVKKNIVSTEVGVSYTTNTIYYTWEKLLAYICIFIIQIK